MPTFSLDTILIGILLLVVLVYIISTRWVRVLPDEVYVTKGPLTDFKRVLKRSTLLINPSEELIRGRHASRHEFPSCDSAGQPRPGYLRHQRSGAIDLRPQFCIAEFIVSTNEPIEMKVKATLQFRANPNPEQLRHLHDLGDNFGRALVTRTKTAFGAEFRKRKDEVVRREMEIIQNSVLMRLNELEHAKPLGVIFDSIDEFDFVQAREPHRTRSFSPAPGEKGQTGDVISFTPHPDGVAFMEAAEYDVIMNLFEHPDQKMRALLAILEMQTRRDVAEALAKSGKLVVVTAQELGLMGTALGLDELRERGPDGQPMRSAKPPGP